MITIITTDKIPQLFHLKTPFTAAIIIEIPFLTTISLEIIFAVFLNQFIHFSSVDLTVF